MDRALKSMQQLGFTASEARIYLWLLRHHPATGYEVAARSGVPRSAVYHTLGRLAGMGVIAAVSGKPARYVPIAPDKLVNLMAARHKGVLDDLEQSLRALDVQPAEASTATLVGYGAVMDQAKALVSQSKKSVVASLWAREAKALAPALRARLRRSVEVILFSFTPVALEGAEVFSYGLPEDGLAREWQHKLIIISDLGRVLVGGAEETDDNRAVITDETTLVEMALSNLVLDITLFGQRHGVETSTVVTRLTTHMAPVDELLRAKRTK
ncbi:MAG TPA: helix-turn-helix domain-containing protein [Polyangia bacterium]